MNSDYQMAWEGARGAARILQDTGPWTWYLAEAWQQAAAPELFNGEPRRPDVPSSHGSDPLARRAAYWSPLLHLTTFGLGWRTPELGLWRWSQRGRLTDDPILATIAARYGNDVDLMTTWLCDEGGQSLRHVAFHESSPRQPDIPVELKRMNNAVHLDPSAQGLGPSGLHITQHFMLWDAGQKPVRRKVQVSMRGEQVDYLLIGEQYRSLFEALHAGITPSVTDGRSTRVGLICPPIGWLGNYRRSRATGLWFRGRHRWHMLGNPPP